MISIMSKLNYNSIDNIGIDNGNDCGFNIVSNNSIGYLKTNNTLTNFLIKSPNDSNINNIL